MNKGENATLLVLAKMAEKAFFISISFFFYEIKCLTSGYHSRCTYVPTKLKLKTEIFMCDFILFLKKKKKKIIIKSELFLS